MNLPLQAVSFHHPDDPDEWLAYTVIVLSQQQTKTLGPYDRVNFFSTPEALHARGRTREEALEGLAALVGDLLARLPSVEVTELLVSPKALPRPTLAPMRPSAP